MALGLNIAVPQPIPTTDHHDAARGDRAVENAQVRRAEEAHVGESLLANTRQTTTRTSDAKRDSFQRTQQDAVKFAQLEVGRQTTPELAMPTPTEAQAQAHAETHAPATEPQTPPATEQANHAPETPAQEGAQSQLAHQEDPQSLQSGTTDQTADVAAPPAAHADEGAHNESHPQSTAQSQPTNPSSSQEGEAVAQRRPTTTPQSEPELTPEQQFTRLQNGGVLAPRTAGPTATPGAVTQVAGTLVAHAEGAPVPMHAPETPAQQAPARSVLMYCSPHLSEDQQPQYAEGLRCMYELAHMEQPRPQGPQASPLSAAAFQQAAPAMTREQMLMSRLNRGNARGRGDREEGVEGLSGGTSGLTREYMIRSRSDMGAA